MEKKLFWLGFTCSLEQENSYKFYFWSYHQRKQQNFETSYTLFYEYHIYKQHQAEIKQKVKNTVMLSLCFLQIIRFLYPCYHQNIVKQIFKTCVKNQRCLL